MLVTQIVPWKREYVTPRQEFQYSYIKLTNQINIVEYLNNTSYKVQSL